MIARVALFLAFALAACEPLKPIPRQRPDAGADAGVDRGTPAGESKPPFGASDLEGRVTVIRQRSEVPLTGSEIEAQSDDLLLQSDQAVALVSARTGYVLAFGPPGGRHGIEQFSAAAFDAFTDLAGKIERIEAAIDGRAVHFRKRLFALPLTIDAWIGLRGRTLLMRWSLFAAEPVAAITLGEQLWWGNTQTWVEGHGFVGSSGIYGGDFLARESHGLAYAFCREGGRTVGRFGSPELAGFHRSARTGEERIAIAAGASSPIRSVAMSYAAGSIGDAVAALPCKPPAREVALPESARAVQAIAGSAIHIARCESERVVLARVERETNAAKKGDPKKAAQRGAGPPFSRYRASATIVMMPEGCTRVRFDAPGHAPGEWIDPDDPEQWKKPIAPRAGRIAWRIKSGDRTIPAAIVVTGDGNSDPDWGDDGQGGAAKNYIYAEADASRSIPPGKYRVTVHRGLEYSIHEQNIEVTADKTVELDAKLERVVDTRGWISADLHVHALPSFDAPVLLEDRVRSLAGVGVEVAVATDHNAVTDYQPAIDKLALAPWVASIVGDEVTTEHPSLGHFNVFPLASGSAPLAFRGLRPAELFTVARKAAPDGVLQVNHPRMDSIGYFELFRFDAREPNQWLGQPLIAGTSFDALEIFNGDHYADIGRVNSIVKDWYALLDAGVRVTATGNSDSHKIGYHEAGMPRNFVALANDDPSALDRAAFLAAIRAGRVVVSSGPFVDFRIGSAGPGEEVPAGEQRARLRVDAPPWMDVSEIDIVRRGEVVRRIEVTTAARPRFERELTISSQAGDWLVCVVRGKKPMRQLYRSGALPFAFTNPIWVK